jgi:hypothetical protein
MTEQLKQIIDSMSYSQMLSKWRFAPAGDPMFQGEIGEYFSKAMGEKEKTLQPGEKVGISKKLGWN